MPGRDGRPRGRSPRHRRGVAAGETEARLEELLGAGDRAPGVGRQDVPGELAPDPAVAVAVLMARQGRSKRTRERACEAVTSGAKRCGMWSWPNHFRNVGGLAGSGALSWNGPGTWWLDAQLVEQRRPVVDVLARLGVEAEDRERASRQRPSSSGTETLREPTAAPKLVLGDRVQGSQGTLRIAVARLSAWLRPGADSRCAAYVAERRGCQRVPDVSRSSRARPRLAHLELPRRTTRWPARTLSHVASASSDGAADVPLERASLVANEAGMMAAPASRHAGQRSVCVERDARRGDEVSPEAPRPTDRLPRRR